MLDWEEKAGRFALPAWEAFPALPLYMDQVIYLVNQYLSLLPERERDQLVTPAMINNYVKLRIIPPPVKKRYGRAHLAYLVMVCVLKQSLNTGEIRKLLPLEMGEDKIRDVYAAFIGTFGEIKDFFRSEARKAALEEPGEENGSLDHLALRSAITANLAKLLTEEILSLYPAREDAKNGKQA